MCLRALSPELVVSVEESARPELAWAQLEAWLRALANPTSMLDALTSSGPLLVSFVRVLGFSEFVGDILVQNPEFGSMMFDSGVLAFPTIDKLMQQGSRLLEAANSTQYRMDRLRWLKQFWIARIALCEINQLWTPAQLWEANSNLAEAILNLAIVSFWASYSSERDLDPEVPIQIIAFGKFGGRELNISSDIDLVYALNDDASPEIEKHAGRFAIAFGRSLEELMGRGALYRVDLRLRPFGGAGALVHRFEAIESYYERYAEPWEQLALIRSRMILGDIERWERLREKVCFSEPVSTWRIETVLQQRAALEELQHGDDIKRGEGGIRDIEFLVQTQQWVEGRLNPSLRGRGTLDVIDALERNGLLGAHESATYREGYVLLRRIEHLLQIENNRQTHSMPERDEARLALARVMGDPDWDALNIRVTKVRKEVRSIYARTTQPMIHSNDRDRVLKKAGSNAEAVAFWIDLLPESEQFYQALDESSDGLNRVIRIARFAPEIAKALTSSVALSEQLISGEILELSETRELISGSVFESARVREIAAWCLAPDDLLGVWLSEVADWGIQKLANGLPIEVVSLGSHAVREMTLHSDLDLVLFCPEGVAQIDAELAAREFLNRVEIMRHEGASLSVDLRLRPEGRFGMLAPTFEAFAAYEEKSMEGWERIAAMRARCLIGAKSTLEQIEGAAYGLEATVENFEELLQMKGRLETERVDRAIAYRHLKHGPGGLDDLNWLCSLTAFVDPRARPEHMEASTIERLLVLSHAGQINAVELTELTEAFQHLINLRWWIELLGGEPDLMPENPNRLELLAEILDLQDGNEVLRVQQEHTLAVRGMYIDQTARLLEQLR